MIQSDYREPIDEKAELAAQLCFNRAQYKALRKARTRIAFQKLQLGFSSVVLVALLAYPILDRLMFSDPNDIPFRFFELPARAIFSTGLGAVPFLALLIFYVIASYRNVSRVGTLLDFELARQEGAIAYGESILSTLSEKS
jgi:hypothetical protein